MTNDIAVYMGKEAVKSRFSEILGNRDGMAFISSVLLAVANNDKLKECTPESIYISALRAATLRLSVDLSLGQAYLVPFKNRKTGKDIATFIPGYKGLYDMAIRTGKYRYINVNPLYEGETIDIDRITGYAKLGGGRTSDKVIGYFGAFEMTTGFFKVIYMTIEEIEAHATQYSKNYNFEDSLWKKEHNKMCRKTVLRILIRKYGYIDPSDAAVLEEVEANNDDLIEGEIVPDEPVDETPKEPMTKEAAMMDLGFDAPNPQKPRELTPSERAHQAVRDSDKKPYDLMEDKELDDAVDSLSNLLNGTVNASRQNKILEKLDAITFIRNERRELATAAVD